MRAENSEQPKPKEGKIKKRKPSNTIPTCKALGGIKSISFYFVDENGKYHFVAKKDYDL